ncbi:MAG: hypothetical protein ACKOWD_19450 [Rhodoferax sp.]
MTAALFAAGAPAAAQPLRLARLALFYDLKLAIVAGRLLQWRGDATPQPVALADAVHVAVAARTGYAVDASHQAWQWSAEDGKATLLLPGVRFLAAGESSVLVIRTDGSLWQRQTGATAWKAVAPAAVHAWVGDSSDYYIDAGGQLWATGRAHRGQYGTGQLTDAPGWVPVAQDALAVYAHTGHAVYLRRDGAVLGTGGNRFGPLATHGLGDKADRWGVIFTGAEQLATGSRHTVALRLDGTLWGWGSDDGTTPRLLLDKVATQAAGDTETIALTQDGRLWQWTVGGRPRLLQTGR